MKRPAQQPSRKPSSPEERRALAARAEYVGSTEHKDQWWWGGVPGVRYDKRGNPARPKRQKTTICRLVSEQDREKATGWIRRAIESGQFKYVEGDQDFPKHVWYQAEGRDWFGFCVNSIAGQYKGWSLEEGERGAFFD
jgi:hypothetical protein